jgi:hypothetical protein
MTRPLATPFVIFCVCANSPPAGVQQHNTGQHCAATRTQVDEHAGIVPLWGTKYIWCMVRQRQQVRETLNLNMQRGG